MTNRELSLMITEAASADYDEEKKKAIESGDSMKVTLRTFAKRWGIDLARLRNYRANHLSRAGLLERGWKPERNQ